VAKHRYIVDTGPLVAYIDRADKHHEWAKGVLDSLGEVPLTIETVIAESCWNLRDSNAAVSAVVSFATMGVVDVHPVTLSGFEHVRKTIATYWPRADLADAGLLWLAEQYPAASVITTDRRDFEIYRTQGNRRVRTILPPS
jgi:predicted nucleic acid-binding protein